MVLIGLCLKFYVAHCLVFIRYYCTSLSCGLPSGGQKASKGSIEVKKISKEEEFFWIESRKVNLDQHLDTEVPSSHHSK